MKVPYRSWKPATHFSDKYKNKKTQPINETKINRAPELVFPGREHTWLPFPLKDGFLGQ